MKEAYTPKTTLHLENDMAEEMMDKYDVGDNVICMVKGKVVSKSMDIMEGKKHPRMSIEIKSIGDDKEDAIHKKMSNMKMKKEKA